MAPRDENAAGKVYLQKLLFFLGSGTSMGPVDSSSMSLTFPTLMLNLWSISGPVLLMKSKITHKFTVYNPGFIPFTEVEHHWKLKRMLCGNFGLERGFIRLRKIMEVRLETNSRNKSGKSRMQNAPNTFFLPVTMRFKCPIQEASKSRTCLPLTCCTDCCGCA